MVRVQYADRLIPCPPPPPHHGSTKEVGGGGGRGGWRLRSWYTGVRKDPTISFPMVFIFKCDTTRVDIISYNNNKIVQFFQCLKTLEWTLLKSGGLLMIFLAFCRITYLDSERPKSGRKGGTDFQSSEVDLFRYKLRWNEQANTCEASMKHPTHRVKHTLSADKVPYRSYWRYRLKVYRIVYISNRNTNKFIMLSSYLWSVS